MARPRFHLLTSTALSWYAHRRWGIFGAAAALAGGLLVDLDHLVDYAWTRWRGEKSHYLAPFHGWEVAGALSLLAMTAMRAVSARRPLPDSFLPRRNWLSQALGRSWLAASLSGLAAGLWLHLLHDVVSNRPKHAGVYSLVFRIRHGFRREITGWDEGTGFHNWSYLPWYRWF